MKELSLDEISLLEKMKSNCLKKGQYIDDKAKDKFKMLCHLEDFSIAYYELLEEKDKEIEKLNKENNDLRKLYQRTYKHLFEIGNDELARYFQAQIDECPTFYVEPIIDYYEETKRLHSIIKEVREYIEYQLENLNFEEDIKAKMLGAMVLVLLDKGNNNE